jgi:hypothetical protein
LISLAMRSHFSAFNRTFHFLQFPKTFLKTSTYCSKVSAYSRVSSNHCKHPAGTAPSKPSGPTRDDGRQALRERPRQRPRDATNQPSRPPEVSSRHLGDTQRGGPTPRRRARYETLISCHEVRSPASPNRPRGSRAVDAERVVEAPRLGAFCGTRVFHGGRSSRR